MKKKKKTRLVYFDPDRLHKYNTYNYIQYQKPKQEHFT